VSLSPQFLYYNATDSVCTLECHNAFWDDLKQGFEPAYRMTVDLFPVLIWLQTRGIKVNFESLNETKVEILSAAATKQEELNKLCGRELNVNSSKDCQAYFYIELGIPPYYNEGRITVDDTALQRLSRGTAKRSGLRQAKLVQEIRGLQKLHSTYLGLEFDDDGRFRSSYNPRGTKFGRLSSSKTIFGTGGNAQNLPQEFKKFLVPDEGYLFWEVDKRQAEWVIMAYLSGDANMIKAIEEGLDTHVHTASLMLNIPHGIIEQESKLVGMNTDPDLIAEIRSRAGLAPQHILRLPRSMSGRQMGKKSNHGLNYDEGYARFALINEIEQSEAKKNVEMYHLAYPSIRGVYYVGIQRQLQKDRTLTNYFGRKVRFMDQWGSDLFKSAYAMLPSSTQVDALNQGLIRIYEDEWICETLNIDILAQVHDSILLQVPWKTVLSEDFKEVMDRVDDYVSPEIAYSGRKFKIATDFKVGLNWGSWSKELNPNGMMELKSPDELPKLLGDLSGLHR